MKLCSTQSPSWEVNSGKVFASYRSDHFNNTVTRKSKGSNTISDVNVSGKSFNFPLSNLTHLDKPITQTVAENIYLCSLYKCFTFKPLQSVSVSIMSLDYNSSNPTRIHQSSSVILIHFKGQHIQNEVETYFTIPQQHGKRKH